MKVGDQLIRLVDGVCEVLHTGGGICFICLDLLYIERALP